MPSPIKPQRTHQSGAASAAKGKPEGKLPSISNARAASPMMRSDSFTQKTPWIPSGYTGVQSITDPNGSDNPTSPTSPTSNIFSQRSFENAEATRLDRGHIQSTVYDARPRADGTHCPFSGVRADDQGQVELAEGDRKTKKGKKGKKGKGGQDDQGIRPLGPRFYASADGPGMPRREDGRVRKGAREVGNQYRKSYELQHREKGEDLVPATIQKQVSLKALKTAAAGAVSQTHSGLSKDKIAERDQDSDARRNHNAFGFLSSSLRDLELTSPTENSTLLAANTPGSRDKLKEFFPLGKDKIVTPSDLSTAAQKTETREAARRDAANGERLDVNPAFIKKLRNPTGLKKPDGSK